jgi:hypothetical protein
MDDADSYLDSLAGGRLLPLRIDNEVWKVLENCE